MLTPTKIKTSVQYFIRQRSITAFDIVIFLRQFATLIATGIPIMKSCHILEKSQHKKTMKTLIHQFKQEIAAGKNLYTCFTSYPQYFDELTCQMIYIGEQTGKLESLLLNIATHHEKQLLFKRKIKQALFYPSLIMVTAMMVCFCMIIFIIPKFAELFHDMQNKLPSITRYVFAISLQIKNNLFILFIVTVSLIFCIYITRQQTKLTFFLIIKQMPIVKSIARKITLLRFCRNLAISFSAGIPISKALQLSAHTNHDQEFSTIIAKLRSKIHAGFELNQAMETMIYFPSLMIEMIKIGEESGLLDQMLHKVADFFEADIDQFTNTLSQTLEPLIILILGVLIGGLVIAMYLPIFKLGNII